jgi:undecaprenyl-diphosphatase
MSRADVLAYINTRDHRLMRRVNGWRAPQWIRFWMLWATRGGDGWLWSAMGAIILLFGGDERFATVGASALAVSLGILLFINLKRICNRSRPCSIEPHCWAHLLPPDQFSFPSGHSITAFAVATPMCLHYPTLAAGLVFCALSIALSRIILGLHFLSDVLAGCAIGFGLGVFAYAIF